MRRAVSSRPVEEFDTDLQLPQWRLEPDDEYYFGDPDEYWYVDEAGNPLEPAGPPVPDMGEALPGPAMPGDNRRSAWVSGPFCLDSRRLGAGLAESSAVPNV
jgi:penicillin-binding protein 1A